MNVRGTFRKNILKSERQRNISKKINQVRASEEHFEKNILKSEHQGNKAKKNLKERASEEQFKKKYLKE